MGCASAASPRIADCNPDRHRHGNSNPDPDPQPFLHPQPVDRYRNRHSNDDAFTHPDAYHAALGHTLPARDAYLHPKYYPDLYADAVAHASPNLDADVYPAPFGYPRPADDFSHPIAHTYTNGNGNAHNPLILY